MASKKIHQLKKLKEIKGKNHQADRILYEMELNEGTEFITNDTTGIPTITITKINNEYLN